MAVVNCAEMKRRRCLALERLNFGTRVSEVNRILLWDYGITLRSENRDINWASAQIVDNLDKYECKVLMAWLIT